MSLTQRDIECLNSVKKKGLNTTNWIDKRLQLQRNSGQEYVNKRGKGDRVQAKNPPAHARGCAEEQCTKRGCATLKLENVHNLHEEFYKLSSNLISEVKA